MGIMDNPDTNPNSFLAGLLRGGASALLNLGYHKDLEAKDRIEAADLRGKELANQLDEEKLSALKGGNAEAPSEYQPVTQERKATHYAGPNVGTGQPDIEQETQPEIRGHYSINQLGSLGTLQERVSKAVLNKARTEGEASLIASREARANKDRVNTMLAPAVAQAHIAYWNATGPARATELYAVAQSLTGLKPSDALRNMGGLAQVASQEMQFGATEDDKDAGRKLLDLVTGMMQNQYEVHGYAPPKPGRGKPAMGAKGGADLIRRYLPAK